MDPLPAASSSGLDDALVQHAELLLAGTGLDAAAALALAQTGTDAPAADGIAGDVRDALIEGWRSADLRAVLQHDPLGLLAGRQEGRQP